MRTALDNDLLWHLHDLWPEQTFPKCALLSKQWAATIGRRLARAEQTARVGIARDELRHLRELSQTIDAREAQIAELVAQAAPQLLAEAGFGPLTAGELIGEIAGASSAANDGAAPRRMSSRTGMEHWRVRLRGVAHAAGPPGAVRLDLALAVSVDVACVAA